VAISANAFRLVLGKRGEDCTQFRRPRLQIMALPCPPVVLPFGLPSSLPFASEDAAFRLSGSLS
jgi:hypothetical protein